MKKIALLSLVAAFAILALSSFIRLTNENNSSNPLASNKDFKSWLTAVTSLKTTIEKTKTKTAFTGFLKRTNTSLENENLAKHLGLKNEQELTATLYKIDSYKNKVIKATPELATDKASEIIHQALQENMLVVPPTCWETYTIRSMNCFSLYYRIADQIACEEAAWDALMNCVDVPIIP